MSTLLGQAAGGSRAPAEGCLAAGVTVGATALTRLRARRLLRGDSSWLRFTDLRLQLPGRPLRRCCRREVDCCSRCSPGTGGLCQTRWGAALEGSALGPAAQAAGSLLRAVPAAGRGRDRRLRGAPHGALHQAAPPAAPAPLCRYLRVWVHSHLPAAYGDTTMSLLTNLQNVFILFSSLRRFCWFFNHEIR